MKQEEISELVLDIFIAVIAGAAVAGIALAIQGIAS